MSWEAILAAVVAAVTKELLGVAMTPDKGEVGKANEGQLYKEKTDDTW